MRVIRVMTTVWAEEGMKDARTMTVGGFTPEEAKAAAVAWLDKALGLRGAPPDPEPVGGLAPTLWGEEEDEA